MTHDMLHVTGGEHSLKILSPLLLRFGKDYILKIGRQFIDDPNNELMKLMAKVSVNRYGEYT